LIQTRKIKNFPVVMVGCEYWGGLLDWIRNTILKAGNISPPDIDLLPCTDDPAEIERIVVESFGKNAPDRPLQPRPPG